MINKVGLPRLISTFLPASLQEKSIFFIIESRYASFTGSGGFVAMGVAMGDVMGGGGRGGALAEGGGADGGADGGALLDAGTSVRNP